MIESSSEGAPSLDGKAPRWSPRVHPEVIALLYTQDAAGQVDEEFLEQVAYAIFFRCVSILQVTDFEQGHVHCPVCAGVFPRPEKDQRMVCPGCGWQLDQRAYMKTYQHQQLTGGSAIAEFRRYLERLPLADSPEETMLLLDAVIHAVHADTPNPPTASSGKAEVGWRPAAVNLIEGNIHTVTALLEELAGRPGYSEALAQAQVDWAEHILPHLVHQQPEENEE